MKMNNQIVLDIDCSVHIYPFLSIFYPFLSLLVIFLPFFQYAKRKAAELEDDFGDEDDSEEAVESRRKIKKVYTLFFETACLHNFEIAI